MAMGLVVDTAKSPKYWPAFKIVISFGSAALSSSPPPERRSEPQPRSAPLLRCESFSCETRHWPEKTM